MLLTWQGEFFSVSITAEHFRYPVTLYRSRSEQTIAIVLVSEPGPTEDAIRNFFEQHGIKVLSDHAVAEGAGSGSILCLAYPLASDASHATKLLKELLGSVYGLRPEGGIDFRYCKMERAI